MQGLRSGFSPFGALRHHLCHGVKRVTRFSGRYAPLRIVFPCHPAVSVGRQKESAFMGRLGALLRPTCTSYAGCAQWTTTRALLRVTYENTTSRSFIVPPRSGGKVVAPATKGGRFSLARKGGCLVLYKLEPLNLLNLHAEGISQRPAPQIPSKKPPRIT